jgi:Arc/MetJ family transcription regulator
VIEDRLVREMLKAAGLKTMREAVEEGLRTSLRLSKQSEIRNFHGKLPWRGDLATIRIDK